MGDGGEAGIGAAWFPYQGTKRRELCFKAGKRKEDGVPNGYLGTPYLARGPSNQEWSCSLQHAASRSGTAAGALGAGRPRACSLRLVSESAGFPIGPLGAGEEPKCALRYLQKRGDSIPGACFAFCGWRLWGVRGPGLNLGTLWQLSAR